MSRKTIFLIVTFSILLNFCSANKASNIPVEKNQQQEVTNNKQQEKISKFLGIDNTITTKWVKSFPIEESLSEFKGKVAVVGNEPFLNFALILNDSTSLQLSGDEEFFTHLYEKNVDTLTLFGELYKKQNHSWLKVYYVLEK